MTRSEEGKEDTKPIVLQREPEALTIRLPFGSREGSYEVQIQKSSDHPLLSATGEAKVENGTTTLTAKMDLSKFEIGNYLSVFAACPGTGLATRRPCGEKISQHSAACSHLDPNRIRMLGGPPSACRETQRSGQRTLRSIISVSYDNRWIEAFWRILGARRRSRWERTKCEVALKGRVD
jgi:hypothetical protein